MTSADQAGGQSEPDRTGPSPGDVPGGRPASLASLDLLVGEWGMEVLFPHDSPVTGQGRTTFEWLEGGHFLIQRMTAGHPNGPALIAVIGAGPDGTLVQNYFDDRGVHRVYQMSVDDGVWRLWRESPGFSQRYTGSFSPDGRTIKGAWEKSPDGSCWEHDFDLTYTKIK